jgi:hypothetical protein
MVPFLSALSNGWNHFGPDGKGASPAKPDCFYLAFVDNKKGNQTDCGQGLSWVWRLWTLSLHPWQLVIWQTTVLFLGPCE